MDETVIILIVLMACFCCMIMMGGLGWYVTRPEEGDECKGKDKKGEYEIDEDGKCVLVSCDDGYVISGKKCIEDKSGDECTPSTTKVVGGVYKTDVAGSCVLDSCSMGYKMTTDGTKCEREPCTTTGGDVDGIYLKSTQTINMCELDSCKANTVKVGSNCHTVYTVSNVFIENIGTTNSINVNSLEILDNERESINILTSNIFSGIASKNNIINTDTSFTTIPTNGKIDIGFGKNMKISKVSFKVENPTDNIKLIFDEKSQVKIENTDLAKKIYTYDDGKWTYST